jgi:hypothetical protein
MIIGYIVMMCPKKRRRTELSDLYAPLAYGDDAKDLARDMLLRDRGATMFKTPSEASAALVDTLTRAGAAGHEWPQRSEFIIVPVKPPLDAEPGV